MSSILSNESAFVTPADNLQESQLGDPVSRGIPRWADAIVAVMVLAVTAPVIGALALMIAATSGAPVFFRQRRVGRGFRPFVLVKLRTMNSTNGGPKVTPRGDQRVTRFGRFLRKTKLDELPTFWNVLRGDMALVGPRPEVPEYVKESDPLWRTVLSVRPGLTDPVTISLRNEEELLGRAHDDTERFYLAELQPAKLRGYISYLEARTLRSDISVLARTVTEIIRGAI